MLSILKVHEAAITALTKAEEAANRAWEIQYGNNTLSGITVASRIVAQYATAAGLLAALLEMIPTSENATWREIEMRHGDAEYGMRVWEAVISRIVNQ